MEELLLGLAILSVIFLLSVESARVFIVGMITLLIFLYVVHIWTVILN